MSKEAVFTMKLEPQLRAEFIAEAEAAHRPASQVLRELMREFFSEAAAKLIEYPQLGKQGKVPSTRELIPQSTIEI